MSRDPEDGSPADPATLHKYLYADGDPVNGLDPMGREDLFENVLVEGGSKLGPVEQFVATHGAMVATGLAVAKVFCWAETLFAQLLTDAGHPTQQPDPEAHLCLLLGP
jgi:hypothetical protein